MVASMDQYKCTAVSSYDWFNPTKKVDFKVLKCDNYIAFLYGIKLRKF